MESKYVVAPVGTLISALDMFTVASCALRSIGDISSNACNIFCVMNELGKCFESCINLLIEGLVLMHIQLPEKE